MASLTRKQLVWIGCGSGAAYGVAARAIFGLKSTGSVFAVMSASFVIGVPIALGFITVWFGEYREKYGWARRVLLPWLPTLVCIACCLALAWEGLICVTLWLPLALVLSSLGGILASLLRLAIPSNRAKTYCIALAALAPFAAAPIESLRKASNEIRTVQTSIIISASPATVWREIRSVPRIAEAEQHFDLGHLIGFPRPIEAVLVGEGVGAVRYARFQGDVLFVEKVTEWRPNERLSFAIHANPGSIPPTTFDEHVTIGGAYFDVLRGTYWIETLGGGEIRLHLSSEQRLSTGFNFYSHLWTEALMADIQDYILVIIKHRCETARPVTSSGTKCFQFASESKVRNPAAMACSLH